MDKLSGGLGVCLIIDVTPLFKELTPFRSHFEEVAAVHRCARPAELHPADPKASHTQQP